MLNDPIQSAESGEGEEPSNPLSPSSQLRPPPRDIQLEEAHPPQPPLPEDSAVTKAEKYERNGQLEHTLCDDDIEAPSAKRVKLEDHGAPIEKDIAVKSTRVKGVAPVKAE